MQQEPAEVMTRRARREQENRARRPRAAGARSRAGATRVGRHSASVRVEAARTRRPSIASASASPTPPASPIPTIVDRVGRRRAAFTAVASSFGLIASLLMASPAQATAVHLAAPLQATALSDGSGVNGSGDSAVASGLGAAQSIRVSDTARSAQVVLSDYSASPIVGTVSAAGKNGGHAAAVAVADALNGGGRRATIVRTALDYFGDRYVLGGASHSGIDCSGLTMNAYAAVGIALPHYVPSQDVLGVPVTEAQAKPGDILVFNNEDHIGIYLGDGMVLHAPATGRTVSIEPVSVWLPAGVHFTRILPN